MRGYATEDRQTLNRVTPCHTTSQDNLKTEYRSTVGDIADSRRNAVAGTARCDNVVQGSIGAAAVMRTEISLRDTASRKIQISRRFYSPKMKKSYPKKVERHCSRQRAKKVHKEIGVNFRKK